MGGAIAFLGFFAIAALVALGLADKQPLAGAILLVLGIFMFVIGIKSRDCETVLYATATGVAIVILGSVVLGVAIAY